MYENSLSFFFWNEILAKGKYLKQKKKLKKGRNEENEEIKHNNDKYF